MYLKKIKRKSDDKLYYILVVINNDDKIKVARFIDEKLFNLLVDYGLKVYDI